MTENLDGQVSLFGPDTWSGKTSPEPCPVREERTKVRTSKPSSRKSSGSSNRTPLMCLCLKREAGPTPESYTMSWGGWSVAYRVHDAQYWGVPQRRKRIALLADFNGLSAVEILFDPQLRGEAEDSEPDEAERDSGTGDRPEIQSFREGLPGHPEPGGEAWEGAAEGPAGCADGTGQTEQRGAGNPGWSGADPLRQGGTRGTSAGGSISFQERAGCDGGARESSCRMSEREPWQPSTTNPSSPEAYGISSLDSNAMKSPNPNSGFCKADTSRTLDLNGGNPACNQGWGGSCCRS